MYGTEWAMSTILDPLIARLRTVGSSLWETVAVEAGAAISLPRKLVSRERETPLLKTVEPLIDYFARVDRGECSMPEAPLPKSVIRRRNNARIKAAEAKAGRTASAPRKAGRPRAATHSKARAPAAR